MKPRYGMVKSMADAVGTENAPARRTFFGHPVGLANLFGVELWERFLLLRMLTILGYYLYYSLTEGGLGLPKATATGVVGAYGGLVYLSTVLGGWWPTGCSAWSGRCSTAASWSCAATSRWRCCPD